MIAMKTTRLKLVMMTVIGAVMFASCNKKDDDDITTDDVSDAVEYSLTSAGEGLTATTDEAIDAYILAASAKNGLADCGVQYDTTITRIGSTATATYNYVFNVDYELSCSGAQATSFDYNYSASGTYDLPRMSSDDAATAAWVVTGLDASSPDYIFNGTYVRQGSQVSKVRMQRSFSTTITYTLNNITVSKTTGYITGGVANINVSGNASTGGSFSFSGTATFTSTTITVVLEGESYIYVP